MSKWRFWMSALFVMCILSGIGYYTSAHTHIVSIVSYPALLGNAWVIEPINRWRAERKTNRELYAQLLALQKKCTILERSHAQLHAKRAYLNGSKELHAFNKRFNQRGKVARVLARTFSDTDHFFLIDAGLRDNVQKDTVVLHNNAVVGRVEEVYPLYSKVCLITDAHCKVGAYCAPTRAQGIHEGSNNQQETQLKFVDHLSKISEGDLVLTSGQGLLFPEGFTLGKVTKVAPDGLYKQVSIAPACDLGAIEYCMLLPK